MVIIFVFPLAFQCRIPNYSTAKTREATVKARHIVQNNGKGGRVKKEKSVGKKPF